MGQTKSALASNACHFFNLLLKNDRLISNFFKVLETKMITFTISIISCQIGCVDSVDFYQTFNNREFEANVYISARIVVMYNLVDDIR